MKRIYLQQMTTQLAHQLFSDFHNDSCLLKKDEPFTQYHYRKEAVDQYVASKTEKGYRLLAIMADDEVIGEIRFKKIVEQQSAEIGIILKDDRFKNKGMGTEALLKAIEYAENQMQLQEVWAEILKSNVRSIHVFEKTGFQYHHENQDFLYYYLNLKS